MSFRYLAGQSVTIKKLERGWLVHSHYNHSPQEHAFQTFMDAVEFVQKHFTSGVYGKVSVED